MKFKVRGKHSKQSKPTSNTHEDQSKTPSTNMSKIC